MCPRGALRRRRLSTTTPIADRVPDGPDPIRFDSFRLDCTSRISRSRRSHFRRRRRELCLLRNSVVRRAERLIGRPSALRSRARERRNECRQYPPTRSGDAMRCDWDLQMAEKRRWISLFADYSGQDCTQHTPERPDRVLLTTGGDLC